MTVTPSPHMKTKRTTKRIMIDVALALIPSAAAGVVYFGLPAALLLLVCVASAFWAELLFYCCSRFSLKNFKQTLLGFFRQFDFTSCVTGLILACSLPASYGCLPGGALGAVFAIIGAKTLFGGTGKNIANPAVTGRIFAFLSFTAATVYPAARFGSVAGTSTLATGATQLARLLQGEETLSALDLFLGTGVGGCLGETCKVAILAGYLFLVLRGVITWYLPLLALAATGAGAVLFGGLHFSLFLPAILSGGVAFGAVFMATDYVTSPKTALGNIIYFILFGFLTALLRMATGVETASFCLLLMNFTVVFFDLAIKARPFGSKNRKKEVAA